MSNSDVKIIFGKFILHIDLKVSFAGNAYFNYRTNQTDEYKDACASVSNCLNKNYYDQKGKAKRVWGRLNDRDIKNPSSVHN